MTRLGKRRANFGLADLFGCDYVKTENGVKNSYLTPRHPHALTHGLEDAPRIIAATQQITVKPHDAAKQPLTLVPSYPDLPMERVFTMTPNRPTRRWCSAARSARAAWSISPWISTAPSGKCWRPIIWCC